MRTVGEVRSLVEDSERSWRGLRGGERLSGRGGEGIIIFDMDHNVERSVYYMSCVFVWMSYRIEDFSEKGVSVLSNNSAFFFALTLWPITSMT